MNESSRPFLDLLLDPNAWSTWAPRSELKPRFFIDADGGPGGTVSLVLLGGRNPLACGCWRLPLSGIEPGRYYRIEAHFRPRGIVAPGKSIRAILTEKGVEGNDSDLFYAHLDDRSIRDGWHLVSVDFRSGESVPALTLQLFLAWSIEGKVSWGDIRLYDLTDNWPSEHKVNLAVVSGNPQEPKSPAACLDFYTERLDQISTQRMDLVCLPELINIAGLYGDPSDLAEPIPGPSSERLSEKAMSHGFYLASSLLERKGDAIYNTGLLIDRSGGILGKYRKTHTSSEEGLLQGVTPGDDYPVFLTDFGKIGYMISYDGRYPEVARILALKGAEVILFSDIGERREEESLWELVSTVRAVDNQVHLAVSVNSGRSCIISPSGEILARTDCKDGSVATARCNLNDDFCDFNGRPINRRYHQLRRSDSYSELVRDLWDKK